MVKHIIKLYFANISYFNLRILMNNQDNINYVNEDEIDLRKLFLKVWEKRIFIILFTFVITSGSVAYSYLIKMIQIPIYSGNVKIEIGEGTLNKITTYHSPILIDNIHNLVLILNKTFDVSVSIPNNTGIIIITAKGTDKNKIRTELEKARKFVFDRSKEKVAYFDKEYFMTRQIGEMIIGVNPINKPKKLIIVLATFVISFVLSIFIVFVIDFFKNIRNEIE